MSALCCPTALDECRDLAWTIDMDGTTPSADSECLAHQVVRAAGREVLDLAGDAVAARFVERSGLEAVRLEVHVGGAGEPSILLGSSQQSRSPTAAAKLLFDEEVGDIEPLGPH